MTAIEHKEIKGLTVKNLIVTVLSTASIVASVMTTYFGLRADIADVKSHQQTTERVNEIRLKLLESEVSLLQDQVRDMREEKRTN